MSRYTDADTEMTEGQYNFWLSRVRRSAQGKRGQAFLRLAEEALLAMPIKKLSRGVFWAPATGEVCFLGAVARHAGKLPELEPNDDGEPDCWLNEESTTETAGFIEGQFDIAHCLAWYLAYENDETWGAWWGEPAEADDQRRYEQALAWVQGRISRREATV